MRRAALALAAALPVALASTRFHEVPTGEGLWRGLSDIPTPALLVAAAATAVTVFLLSRRMPFRTTAPLLALLASALPALAVVTGGLPLLLVFQGPVLFVVAVAAVAVCVWRAGHAAGLEIRGSVLFAAAFAFYLGLGLFLPGPAGPQGDEPHYLVTTLSLLRDFDVDLQNQFRERQYAEFFAGTLEPHTSPASPPGHLYSIHAPGLPALLMPAYALFGYTGAKMLMSAMCALAGVLVHRLVRQGLGSPGPALAAWAAFTFTPPLPFYAVAIYPEVPAALASAVFLLAARADPSRAMLLAAVLAADSLPFIHPKFLPLAALGLLLVLSRALSWRARLLSAASFALAWLSLLWFFAAVYGHPSVSAAYGPGFASDVSLARVPRGALGLLFDRQFGLFAVAPVWALALPGAFLLARRRLGDAMRGALIGLASFGVGASFSMWWGGSCPPARFVLPALPALALFTAPALQRRRGLGAALAGVGLAFVAITAAAPRALHNRADGESALLHFLAPALDLDDGLPGFVSPASQRGPLLAASASAAGALAWQLGPGGALVGTAGFALVSGALRTTPVVSARGATLELLERWDETNLRGPTGPPELRTLRVPLELPLAPWTFDANQLRNSRPLDLPPGLYEARLEARVTEAYPTARVAKLDLATGDLLLERRYLREDQRLAPFPLVLPVGARRLVLSGSGIQGKGEVASATLEPRFLVPRRARDRFTWPRQPEEDGYRAEASGVRVTAIDATPDAGAFRVETQGRFVVEASDGQHVRIRVERERPSAADDLLWGELRLPLGGSKDLTIDETADQGFLALGLRLVPAMLRAQGSRITFSGSRGETRATASSEASPASLPKATSTSAPPDSAKK